MCQDDPKEKEPEIAGGTVKLPPEPEPPAPDPSVHQEVEGSGGPDDPPAPIDASKCLDSTE